MTAPRYFADDPARPFADPLHVELDDSRPYPWHEHDWAVAAMSTYHTHNDLSRHYHAPADDGEICTYYTPVIRVRKSVS